MMVQWYKYHHDHHHHHHHSTSLFFLFVFWGMTTSNPTQQRQQKSTISTILINSKGKIPVRYHLSPLFLCGWVPPVNSNVPRKKKKHGNKNQQNQDKPGTWRMDGRNIFTISDMQHSIVHMCAHVCFMLLFAILYKLYNVACYHSIENSCILCAVSFAFNILQVPAASSILFSRHVAQFFPMFLALVRCQSCFTNVFPLTLVSWFSVSCFRAPLLFGTILT